MAEFSVDDMLEEMAIRASTLVANPNSVQARAAMKRSLSMWRAWKARKSLPELAAEADAETRAQPGYRADLNA